MSNNNENNLDSMSPTVRAVYAALGGTPPSEKAVETVQQEAPAQTNTLQEEPMTFEDAIVVDIYEENGQIVELDNGVISLDDELPYIDVIEKYRGESYIDDMINEGLFDSVKSLYPNDEYKKKFALVEGDLLDDDLGLSDQDKLLLIK